MWDQRRWGRLYVAGNTETRSGRKVAVRRAVLEVLRSRTSLPAPASLQSALFLPSSDCQAHVPPGTKNPIEALFLYQPGFAFLEPLEKRP